MASKISRFGLLWLAIFVAAGCGGSEAGRGGGGDTALVGSDEGGERTRSLQTYGQDLDHAVQIGPGIYQARGTGNAHMIVTDAGRVIFDAGLPTQADRLRALLDAVDRSPITHVIASHAHQDHTGGVDHFRDEGTEFIAHRSFADLQQVLYEAAPYLMRRNKRFYPDVMPPLPDALLGRAIQAMYPTFEPTIVVDDQYVFELGGRRFEVIHTPGAEGDDSISLWLPDDEILFTGDFFGPIFPMFPNLTTVRGEPYRDALPYLRSLDRVLALEPRMLVPSHFEPIEGKARIRADVTKTRDAVRYVYDETIEAMNAGKDVWTAMREIELPPELELSQAHGTVRWTVRGIWENVATWFHFRSTTELYPVPVWEVYGDLAELAGGAGPLAERAAAKVAAGQPEAALHLTEVALSAEPDHAPTLRAKLAALELLLERAGGVNHHEVFWIEHEIAGVRNALGEGA